jgi:hypothetical protein
MAQFFFSQYSTKPLVNIPKPLPKEVTRAASELGTAKVPVANLNK